MENRRDKGTGTIIERNGKFIGRYRYTDEFGRDKEKSFTCDSEKEADKKLKAFIKTLNAGEYVAEELTLGQWLDKAFETIYRAKLRPNTYALYQGFANNHFKELRKIDLTKLTTQLLEKHIESRTMTVGKAKIVKPLSGQSKNHLRRFIINVLNHAVRLGHLKTNPAERTLPPLILKKRLRVLSLAETNLLLETITSPFYKAMFGFQLYLGLRIGEVLGLKWDEIEVIEEDGQERIYLIHIRQQMQRNRQTKTLGATELKTETAERTLVLNAALVELLQSMDRKGQFIFSTGTGKPYEPRNAQRALDAWAKKAKLGHIPTHSLRRTYATLSVQANTGINVISQSLGHSDLRTTLIYAKTSMEALREAGANLTKLMG